MAAKKGTMPPNAGKGRKPGSKNVAPLQVAKMVQTALHLAGAKLQEDDKQRIAKQGGDACTSMLGKMSASEAYLMTQALEQPKIFMTLVAKLMPTKLEGEVHLFDGAALVDRLQQGRALAAERLVDNDDKPRVH